MTRPSDSHWALLTGEQQRKTRIILETLVAERIRFVLGGGWAVYAHDATTPSIDCDVFIKGRPPDHVVAALSQVGIGVGPQRDLECLPLDAPMELLGTGEEDLGIAPVSFIPSKIFHGHLESRTLSLDKPVNAVPVPDRFSLAITKLCALQGRGLAYRSFTDGEARMRLGPVAGPQILSLSQSYYLRKAGKDLFDVSLLLQSPGDVDAVRDLAGPRLWAVIRADVAALPAAIGEMGVDLARRVGKPSPAKLVPLLAA